MPDTLRAALIFPIGFIALLIASIALWRGAGFMAVNLFALLTMRPGKRYSGWRWDVVRRYVYSRDRHECRECGYSYRQLFCHHKRPVALGGSYQTWNLETLCAECHARRHPGNARMWR